MSKEISSYNSRQAAKEDLRHIFIPSGLEISLYLIVGSLVLLLLNARVLWDYFNNSSVGDENLRDLIAQSIPGVDTLSRVAQGRVFLAFFWAIVGILIYSLYWFVKSIAVNFRNDIVVGEYFVHPENFSKKRYWISIASSNLFFAINCILFIAFIYAAVRLAIVLGKFCYTSFINFTAVSTLPRLAGAVVAIALLFHLLFMLLHIIVRSWRHIE